MDSTYFSGKRVLVTGGLGFIGSNLAHRLAGSGARITLIDSLIPEYGGNLHNIRGIEDKVAVNISDVRDEHSMRYLVQGHDYLFNLAGQTSHMDSMSNPKMDLEINCQAQLSILEACRHYNPKIKVVFASTRQVYGRPDYLPVNERHPIRPVDVNGISKTAGEWYHILYNNVYGIRTCVLRLTNTYGPRMRIKDARQTFLGVWIRLLLQQHPFDVWEGHQLRDFNYVEDCLDALLLAAMCEESNGQIYNLGDQKPISLHDLADLLVKLNGSGSFNVRVFPTDRKKIDIGDYYSDFTKFASAVGWRPKVSLADGLATTLDFFRANLSSYL
jgi:UDP-glucose 4-epimerase